MQEEVKGLEIMDQIDLFANYLYSIGTPDIL